MKALAFDPAQEDPGKGNKEGKEKEFIERFKIERRCFSYTEHIPERRRGRDRRKISPKIRICD